MKIDKEEKLRDVTEHIIIMRARMRGEVLRCMFVLYIHISMTNSCRPTFALGALGLC